MEALVQFIYKEDSVYTYLTQMTGESPPKETQSRDFPEQASLD